MSVLKCAGVILSIIVFSSCTNSVEKTESPDNPDIYSDLPEPATDTTVKEYTQNAPLPVVNRPHYHTVEIKLMKFFPEELTVSKGDTVVWVNNGITAHDVTQQPSGAWTSSSIAVGKSWSMVVKESSDYYCSIHVVMTGKLIAR